MCQAWLLWNREIHCKTFIWNDIPLFSTLHYTRLLCKVQLTTSHFFHCTVHVLGTNSLQFDQTLNTIYITSPFMYVLSHNIATHIDYGSGFNFEVPIILILLNRWKYLKEICILESEHENVESYFLIFVLKPIY